MYFTDDKKLQRFEREMKIVPNFERKEFWEYADSCRDCKNYECKLESCMEARCPYLKRKIRSNFIVTRDLVETFLVDNPYISTYGIYLDKVTDMEYRAQLLEILEPKQHALEKAEFGFAFGEIL